MGNSIFGGVLSLIAMIVMPIIGYIESGSLMGAAVVFAIAFLACLLALIGFIPFGIGPGLYVFFIYPALSNAIQSMQPFIHVQMALLGVFVITIIISVIYTIVSSLVILILAKR